MKKRYLFLLLIFTYLGNFSCNAQSLEAKYDSFQEELKHKIITPTYRIKVESDTIRFEDFFIRFSELEDSLKIYVNNDTLFVNDMITQNNVETNKIQVDYSNAISFIQYYSYYDILMFQTYYYPCSGLGCGVNFQILYHTKTKKTFAFGRFRTGYDMELYSYNREQPYYLSKSFDGRNIQGIDTITYQLFPIDFSLTELKPLKKINAKAVFDVNQTEKIISFDKNWLE